MRRRVLAFLLVLLALPLHARQSRPLPDKDAFVREVRARLQPDADRQRNYSYVETRRQAKLDSDGRPHDETVGVIESSPGSLPGEPRWERVISEDGRPTPPAELEKADRKRREEAEAFQRKQSRKTDGDRARDA